MNTHQFNNEPFRILLASLASGYQATDGFLASTLSKHLLRELKASDTALKNPESLRWNPVLKRYGTNAKADDDDEADGAEHVPEGESRPKLPSKENPIGVAVYGQICLAAKSYQSAICESPSLQHGVLFSPFGKSICCMPTTIAHTTPSFAYALPLRRLDVPCNVKPIIDTI